MISKPRAKCPRCGGRLTVRDLIDVKRHAESVTYYAECECGAADITVSGGKITGITLREPIDIPLYEDIPPENLEYPGSIAI